MATREPEREYIDDVFAIPPKGFLKRQTETIRHFLGDSLIKEYIASRLDIRNMTRIGASKEERSRFLNFAKRDAFKFCEGFNEWALTKLGLWNGDKWHMDNFYFFVMYFACHQGFGQGQPMELLCQCQIIDTAMNHFFFDNMQDQLITWVNELIDDKYA